MCLKGEDEAYVPVYLEIPITSTHVPLQAP